MKVLLLQGCMIQLDVISSDTSQAGQNLSKWSNNQILAMAEREKILLIMYY